MTGKGGVNTDPYFKSPLKIFSFLSHLRGYFQNYHMSSQTHIIAFFVPGGLMLPILHKFAVEVAETDLVDSAQYSDSGSGRYGLKGMNKEFVSATK